MKRTLGSVADAAALVAKNYGHTLTPWREGSNGNGMNWFCYCVTCGATAIAEYDEHGRPVANGNTQRLSCWSIVKRKARKAASTT